MARKLITADAAVTKLITRSQAATGDYEAGIKAAGTSGLDAAIAAAPRWASGVQDAVNNDRFKKGIGAVDRTAYLATLSRVKGSDLVAGLQKRVEKTKAKFTKLFGILGPHVDEMRARVVTNDAEAKQKMLDNYDFMSNVKEKMRA